MGSPILRLLKGSSIYGVGNAMNQVLGVLLLPLFTSYLSPEDYGILAVLNLASFFLVQIFSIGINTAIGIIYYDNKSIEYHKDATVWTAVIILTGASSFMIISGSFFLNDISNLLFSTGKLREPVLNYLFYTSFTILIQPFFLRLQFDDKQIPYVILTIISTILTIGLSLYLVVYLKQGVNGMVIGYTLSKFISLLLFAGVTLRNMRLIFRWQVVRELIKNGVPLVPSFFSIFLISQANVFFIEKFYSLDASGLYSMGYNLAGPVGLIIGSFSIAWFPFFMSYKHRQDEANILFSKITLYYLVTMGLISVLFYVFAQPVIILLTQPDFYPAYAIIGLSTTFYVLLGMQTLLTPPIIFIKEVYFISLSQITGAIVYITSAIFFLIPRYHEIGAIIASILGYLTINLLIIFWCKINRRRYFNIDYEWRRILAFIALYIVTASMIFFDFGLGWKLKLGINILIFSVFALIVYLFYLRPEISVLLNILSNLFKNNSGQSTFKAK